VSSHVTDLLTCRGRPGIRALSPDGAALRASHQRLEEGLRAVAVPIRGAADVGTAAVNVSAHAARVSIASLRGDILPALLGTVRAIEAGLLSVIVETSRGGRTPH